MHFTDIFQFRYDKSLKVVNVRKNQTNTNDLKPIEEKSSPYLVSVVTFAGHLQNIRFSD